MTEKETSQITTRELFLLILVCFFFSGITGLTYEILWTRMITKIIGGAPFAISIILTIFMGGLGLGSYLASRIIDRVKEPLKLVRIYGILELIIGGYGLAVPFMIEAFKPLYKVLYNQLFPYAMVFHILTFVGCTILFCIPVFCMGATLPVLCRFYITKLSHLATHAGRLYGLNTIGAAFGSLLCGFWLITLLGMTGTLVFAILINLLIGLSCVLVSYRARVGPDKTSQAAPQSGELPQPGPATAKPEYPGARTGVLVIFAVSGFCAMAYEVIWTKLLGLIVGPTTYSFTIVLVTFILGLALGSIFFGWLGDKTNKVLGLLISTQIVAALLVLAVSQFLGNSQLFFAKVIFHFRNQFALLSLVKIAILFVLMIFPTLCLGATFPLVGKIYTQSISRVGRSIGFAYAINTVGAVLGSFCGGFVLIPFFGKERGLSLTVGLQLLTALAVAGILFSRKRENLQRFPSLAIPALLGVLLCVFFPSWDRHLLAKGKYHRFHESEIDVRSYGWLESIFRGPALAAPTLHADLVYYGDGVGGFTTVLEERDYFGNLSYSMLNSGKPDASSRRDMVTQTLVTHFPMMFHPNAKRVMVLGLASGITAGEVLYYPIERLDVIDISPQVVKASDFFLPWNNNVLSNPKTNLIIQDGRAHLQLTDQKYDVIISEPSNPWMAGLAILFTLDFFALAHDRLNEGGIFAQFIHEYEMDWPAFALVGRAFAHAFPNSLMIASSPDPFMALAGIWGDYILVGIKGENKLDLNVAEKNLPYIKEAKNVTLLDARLLYKFIVSEDLRNLFGPGPLNTDNWPLLEFAAPKLMHHYGSSVERAIQSRKWLMDTTKEIVKQVALDVEKQIDFAAYAFSLFIPFRNMVDLSKAAPGQKERFLNLLFEYCANNPIDFSLFEDEALKQRIRNVQIRFLKNKIDRIPNKADAYFYLAYLYKEEGKSKESMIHYAKALEIKPDFIDAHVNLGVILMDKKRFDEAIMHFKKALRINPRDEDGHRNLGLAMVHQGRFKDAIEHFTKALEINPALAEVHSGLGHILASQGDLVQAVYHFETALRIKPDLENARKGLHSALQTLRPGGRQF